MTQKFRSWLYIWGKKTLIQKDTCIPMFLATLFTVVKILKQPKCLSTDERVKMWCVCVYVCVHAYVYICVYMYTHIYIHTSNGVISSYEKE